MYSTFSEKLKNDMFDICEDLKKVCNETAKRNKPIEKLGNIVKQLNVLIELQKDFSFINRKSQESNEIRKEQLKVLLDNYIQEGHISNVSILESKCGNGFGLCATKPINQYELTMAIPLDKMITEQEAFSSNFGQFLSSNMLTKTKNNIALSLFLLHECLNPESVHKDYINSLPVNVDTFLYWTLGDIEKLRFSQYLPDIIKQFSFVCMSYCYLFSALRTADSLENCIMKDMFCFEDFRWAVSVVMSRNNLIPIGHGQSHMLALIPIWDMINHKTGEFTTDFDIDNKCLKFYTMDSYEQDDEVYMDYGKRSSFHFLIYSGFIPEKNPHDTFSFNIAFTSEDLLYNTKKELLKKLSIDCDNPIFEIKYLEPTIIGQSLSVYLAIMLTQSDSILDRLLTYSIDQIYEYCQSVEDEIKRCLKSRLTLSLNILKKVIPPPESKVAILLNHEISILSESMSKL